MTFANRRISPSSHFDAHIPASAKTTGKPRFFKPAMAMLAAVVSMSFVARVQGQTLGGPVLPIAQTSKTSKIFKTSKTSGARAQLTVSPSNRLAQNLLETQPRPVAITPVGQGDAASGASALGALPFDAGLVRRVKVAGKIVSEAPLRVGNLDVLAPIIGENSSIISGLGVSVTRVAPGNVPGNLNTPTGDQSFQINLPQGAPIIMTVGKATAYINNVEQTLRAAPLVINDKIWLPLFSVAPLIGAAPRLDPGDGTLHLSPTVQSVELFTAKGYTVMTVKTSAPIREGTVLMGTMDNPPKLYFDFLGYSMGFDAANSTGERAVSAGIGVVTKARAGLFESFPDKTRVVLDLKKEMTGVLQPLPDKSLYAIVIVPVGGVKPRITVPESGDPPPPSYSDDPNATLRGLTIVVDAGHGGHDSGAPGHRSLEKTHALDIARRLKNNLESRGATVLMTRDGDYFITLQGRSTFANTRHADIFVSCHLDSADNRSASGSSVHYSKADSLFLAREVQTELVRATGLKNRGIHRRPLLSVTRRSLMPAVLTESAFMSNASDEALAMNPQWRERVARGIAQGISNYVVRYNINR
jgi:N-acetylmuramoyl-L-alanine amidase